MLLPRPHGGAWSSWRSRWPATASCWRWPTSRAGEALELWLVAASGLVVSGVLITMLKAQVDGMVLQLADAARTDPLTGLLNRRGFEEAFELEVERARRGEHTLSLLIGDLDRFKQVNDLFGHHAGDRRSRAPARCSSARSAASTRSRASAARSSR